MTKEELENELAYLTDNTEIKIIDENGKLHAIKSVVFNCIAVSDIQKRMEGREYITSFMGAECFVGLEIT
jgi:hypothetical protein